MNENEHLQVFDDWLSKHKSLLFKVVRAYALTTHHQEDLFQEITLQARDSIPNFRQQSAVTTWLYRVALYSAIAWSKKEKKQTDIKQTLAGSGPALSKAVARNDPRLDWIYEQISKLDEIDRSLTLLLPDGFSYRDMAEALGISESNVGVKINRIKKHLARLSFEIAK